MLVDLSHYSMSFGKERACYVKAPALASFLLVLISSIYLILMHSSGDHADIKNNIIRHLRQPKINLHFLKKMC